MFKLFGKNKTIEIGCPLKGEAVPVTEVNDPTFSENILGTGVAVRPAKGRIVAPADGTIGLMFETGHALSMVTNDGVELLIHVGLDTIKLKGKHYTIHAGNDQKVKKGDLLIEFDPEAIVAEGFEVITPVVVTNPGDYKSVEVQTGPMEELTPLILITK